MHVQSGIPVSPKLGSKTDFIKISQTMSGVIRILFLITRLN